MKIEDKEDLIDILDHAGFKVALSELDTAVREFEAKVLQFSLGDAQSIQQLAIEKARAEGARRLFIAFKQRMDKIRPTKK